MRLNISRIKICCWSLTIMLMSAMAAVAVPLDYDRSNGRGNQVLLRAHQVDLDRLVAQYGLTVLGNSEKERSLLVAGPEGIPADQLAALLVRDAAVSSAEPATLAALPGLQARGASGMHVGDVVPDLLQTGRSGESCWSRQAAEPWSGFANQSAAELIRLPTAHETDGGCGLGVTVAILDTGIDPNHPLLVDALVPGYDFLFETAGLPSEYRLVPDQSMTTIVEQSMTTIVEQSMTTIVEADQIAVLAGRGEATDLGNGIAPVVAASNVDTLEAMGLPPFFGHGTMVAGLVRWTAPQASIMPIRVFDGNGRGHLFDIVRAIYWAVDHGADIINMSFTVGERSKELQEALRYAQEHGVVCVAAAGNQGEHTLAFPAADAGTVGVAATTFDDELAEFSNHGAQLADLAAPGAGVISTYPGRHYAAGWGTSFAAPLVSGTLALVYRTVPGSDQAASRLRSRLLSKGSQLIKELVGDVGNGRLDALGTILESQ